MKWPLMSSIIAVFCHVHPQFLDISSSPSPRPRLLFNLQLLNFFEWLFFISSYSVSISSLLCFPHPLCTHISSFHNVSDKLSFICFDYVAMSCQTCFLIFFAMSTTSHLHITCPYYLYLTFLYFLTLRISSSHNISDKLSFISLITCPCHVKLASSPSLQCLPPQIF
jgi:hypothetical protein